MFYCFIVLYDHRQSDLIKVGVTRMGVTKVDVNRCGKPHGITDLTKFRRKYLCLFHILHIISVYKKKQPDITQNSYNS